MANRLPHTSMKQVDGGDDVDLQMGAEFLLNDDWNRADGLAPCVVIKSRSILDPSTLSPGDGDVYYVPSGAFGAWFQYDGQFAIYRSGWLYVTPPIGAKVYVADESGKVLIATPSGLSGWAAASADIGGSPGGTASTYLPPSVAVATITGVAGNDLTLQAVPNPADTPSTADVLRDDLSTNTLPAISNDLVDLAGQLNVQSGTINPALRSLISSLASNLTATSESIRASGLMAGSVLYLQAAQCSNHALVDKWKLKSTISSLPAVYDESGTQYYFTSLSPASSIPGTLMVGETYVGTSCSTYMRAMLCDGATYSNVWKAIDGITLPAVYSYGGVYYKFDTGQTTTQDPTGLTIMDGSESLYGSTCPTIFRQAKYCGNSADIFYSATIGSISGGSANGMALFNGGASFPAGTYYLFYLSGAFKWSNVSATGGPYSGYGAHAFQQTNGSSPTGRYGYGAQVLGSGVFAGSAPGSMGEVHPLRPTSAGAEAAFAGDSVSFVTSVSGTMGVYFQLDAANCAGTDEPTAVTVGDNDSGSNPTFKLGTTPHYNGQISDVWIDETRGLPYYFTYAGVRYFIDSSSARAVATVPGTVATGETAEVGCP